MAISPRFATRTLPNTRRILPADELRRPVDRRPRALASRSSSLLFAVAFPATTTGRPASSASRWRPTGSTGGSRAARAAPRRSARCSTRSPTRCSCWRRSIVLLDQDVFPAWMVAAIVAPRAADLGPAPGGGRARRRDRGARPRQARRPGRRRSRRRSAGSPRRASWRDDVAWWALLVALVADVGLRARLRPLGAAGPARPRGRLALTRLPD